jgi:SAM-dependent methyltransferase
MLRAQAERRLGIAAGCGPSAPEHYIDLVSASAGMLLFAVGWLLPEARYTLMSARTEATCFKRTRTLRPNLARYERIAPFYDLLDLPFERRRYHALRPLLFQNLKGRLLDAGIGTGRNCAFYPPETIVSGIDTSPAMLARARRRCPTLSAGGRLYRMDVTALEFPAASFDAAVATFLFCVLPESQQVPALRELDRVVRPGGLIRLLEYVRPRGTLRRMVSRLWDPWIAWAYGASLDRQTELHVLAAGLEIVESRYVVDDLVKLLTLHAH